MVMKPLVKLNFREMLKNSPSSRTALRRAFTQRNVLNKSSTCVQRARLTENHSNNSKYQKF